MKLHEMLKIGFRGFGFKNYDAHQTHNMFRKEKGLKPTTKPIYEASQTVHKDMKLDKNISKQNKVPGVRG